MDSNVSSHSWENPWCARVIDDQQTCKPRGGSNTVGLEGRDRDSSLASSEWEVDAAEGTMCGPVVGGEAAVWAGEDGQPAINVSAVAL